MPASAPTKTNTSTTTSAVFTNKPPLLASNSFPNKLSCQLFLRRRMNTALTEDLRSRPQPKAPQWQRVALRKLYWQALGIILFVVAMSVAVTWLMHRFVTGDRAEYGIVAAMLLIFAPTTIVYLAYRRGVSDGRAHPTDFQTREVDTTSNQAVQQPTPRSDE